MDHRTKEQIREEILKHRPTMVLRQNASRNDLREILSKILVENDYVERTSALETKFGETRLGDLEQEDPVRAFVTHAGWMIANALPQLCYAARDLGEIQIAAGRFVRIHAAYLAEQDLGNDLGPVSEDDVRHAFQHMMTCIQCANAPTINLPSVREAKEAFEARNIRVDATWLGNEPVTENAKKQQALEKARVVNTVHSLKVRFAKDS